MKVLLLLAALVAVDARAKPGTCEVSEWGEWSEFRKEENVHVSDSFSSPDVPSAEDDLGRKQFAKVMAEKQALAEYRAACRKSGDCSDMHKNTVDGPAICIDGFIDDMPCSNIDQLDYVDLPTLGEPNRDGNDCWGWTDSLTSEMYVIMGTYGGTTFVNITDPTNAVVRATMNTETSGSDWRDMKTIGNWVYVVSEATGHGIQVFDMRRLRDESGALQPDNVYGDVGSCHNIVALEGDDFIFGVGCDLCSGGLYAVNVRNPTAPVYAGCYDNDLYVHDAQCMVYDGPDTDYTAKQVCFCYNEDTLTIVDVTDKSDMRLISRVGYADAFYTHQGWLTEDKRFALMDDESDEMNLAEKFTRTHIWDVQDLDAPVLVNTHIHPQTSIDHNQYMVGNLTFQANYESGLRVLEFADNGYPDSPPTLREVAFVDVYPPATTANFNGAWNVYPFFANAVDGGGPIAVSSINDGLFIFKFADTFSSSRKETKTPHMTRSRFRQIIKTDGVEFCPALVEYERVRTQPNM